jgi:pilus assembly protein CpaC
LVTSDGKEASFLVGGEFLIPALQGGANSGAVTIQFREYGVRLTFTPNITGRNNIRLHVKPEVSALDYTNALSFNGFTIPALSSRKMETNIELGEGQSFVIAGLIDRQVTETLSKIPVLSSLPILGNLFKSKEFDRNNTELVVMVTPEVTTPLQPGDAKPMPTMPRPFLVPLAPGSTNAFPTDSKGKTK